MEQAEKIEQIVKDAAAKKASDIHCTPGSPMMYRIDGSLVAVTEELTGPTDVKELLAPILTDQQVKELEEKGELGFAYSLQGVGRIRMNVYRQRGTYAMALRILPSEIFTPEELKIPPAVVEMAQMKKGLFLVTGAAGSGKSTTLASLLQMISEKETKNIITIEDPIEHLFRHNKSMISQREVGYDTNSYAEALKAALRQDPDIIMIGEMRDLETIELALAAAETGHLVFATLHTDHVTAAVERLIEVFPPYQQQQVRVQLSNVLLGVVTQQLLPRADETGRVAIYEVMRTNKEIKEMIRTDRMHQMMPLMSNSKKEGMQTMDDAIYSLYMQSSISAETAIRFAEDSVGMQQKVVLF